MTCDQRLARPFLARRHLGQLVQGEHAVGFHQRDQPLHLDRWQAADRREAPWRHERIAGAARGDPELHHLGVGQPVRRVRLARRCVAGAPSKGAPAVLTSRNASSPHGPEVDDQVGPLGRRQDEPIRRQSDRPRQQSALGADLP